MKNILKISVALIVMQIIVTEAIPTSTKANQPPKDPLFDLILGKANDYYANSIFVRGTILAKLAKVQIISLERKQDNGDEDYDAKTHQDLKNALEEFLGPFEKFNNDEANCFLQRDIVNDISEFEKRLYPSPSNREKAEAWYKILHPDSIPETLDIQMLIKEMNEHLLELFENFVQNLQGSEKDEMEELTKMYEDKYVVLFNFYTYQLKVIRENNQNAGDKVDNDEQCKVLNLKRVLSFLTTIFYMNMGSSRISP